MTWNAHIIDANLNRAREGLRVLEDLARFMLHDDALRAQARDLRHQLQTTIPIRNVVSDSGAQHMGSTLSDPIRVLNANAARTQEALRVLEEVHEKKELYSRIRFAVYDLHQKLFGQLRLTKLKGLYTIIDLDTYPVTPEQIKRVTATSGSQIAQLRYKSASKRKLLATAQEIRSVLPKEVLFIVNDHLDVALSCADGVHLGQEDLPVASARRICPAHFIIGASAHDLQEAVQAERDGASYVGMGAVFATSTKCDARRISIEEIARAKNEIAIPICAIGGINARNQSELHCADMVAMCSALWRNDT